MGGSFLSAWHTNEEEEEEENSTTLSWWTSDMCQRSSVWEPVQGRMDRLSRSRRDKEITNIHLEDEQSIGSEKWPNDTIVTYKQTHTHTLSA